MKKYLSLLISIAFLAITFNCFSQKLELRVQEGRYNVQSQRNRGTSYYKFIGHAYIDPSNKGIFDYSTLKKRLTQLFPLKTTADFVVIDIENKIFLDLKSNSLEKREVAADELVKLIRFVKNYRPNLRVGIYGLPFRFNYDFQKKQNHFKEIKKVLATSDFLAPDLYFSFSCEQQNQNAYTVNVQENLNLFSEFAISTGKPLYPFVWYKIHPYNKKFGGQQICKSRMDLLLSIIKQHSYKNSKVSGVLWWENWYKGIENHRSELSGILEKYTSGKF